MTKDKKLINKVIEKLEKALDYIETERKSKTFRFNMGDILTITSCGTSACIAGTVYLLENKKKFKNVINYESLNTNDQPLNNAQDILHLRHDVAQWLFYLKKINIPGLLTGEWLCITGMNNHIGIRRLKRLIHILKTKDEAVIMEHILIR
jgi:hypothetical protein